MPKITSDNSPDHPDVMISSTFTDLIAHRQSVIDALLRLSLFPIGMELDSAKANKTVIDSSFEMLKRAHAYIGILSHRYGSVPKDAARNPQKLSITELEYREALRLGIPVFMFLMSNEHLITVGAVEESSTAKKKLARLKQDAKERSICAEFGSVEDLRYRVLQSMADFKAQCSSPQPILVDKADDKSSGDFPPPPNFVAVPNFVSGHTFVGRKAELELLDTWAAGKDSVMLVEAIGGAGKSALAWEWIKENSQRVIPRAAGTFWYSFYQGGSNMDSFIVNALAYTMERAVEDFHADDSSKMARQLLTMLQQRPFLIVLDGLERILVAYDRFDAAQSQDDEVPSANNDRASIRPSDDALLRALVGVHPSKIIITSRLQPASLTETNRTLKGVQVCALGGLIDSDALDMMRNEGITGDSYRIKQYLKENFNNHPLMIGIVAGLVNDYAWAPGDFDRWVDDPQSNAIFKTMATGVSQRRVELLGTAIRRLEPGTKQLLSRIAALPVLPVPFETVEALSPHKRLSDPVPKLISSLRNLEERGLLQWDRKMNTYDLHPVVRGYAFDSLEEGERKKIYDQIIDHFESKPAEHYENVKLLTDVQQSINTFQSLVQAGRLDEAADFLMNGFAEALLFSIEAFQQILVYLRPFFPRGFQAPPVQLRRPYAETYLMNCVAIALRKTARSFSATEVYLSQLNRDLKQRDELEVHSLLVNLALSCFDDGRIAASVIALELALELSRTFKDKEAQAITYLHLMRIYRRTGRFESATTAYQNFRRLKTPTRQHIYRVGDLEAELCWLKFYQRQLPYDELKDAQSIALNGGRETNRSLATLEGEVALSLGKVHLATAAFDRAIEMGQLVAIDVKAILARLAFAMAVAGEIQRASQLCAEASHNPPIPDCELSVAYLEIGNAEKALSHALRGYEWAWGEGPPCSRYLELAYCRRVFEALQQSEPKLPLFAPSRAKPLTCELNIQAYIRWLKSKRG